MQEQLVTESTLRTPAKKQQGNLELVIPLPKTMGRMGYLMILPFATMRAETLSSIILGPTQAPAHHLINVSALQVVIETDQMKGIPFFLKFDRLFLYIAGNHPGLYLGLYTGFIKIKCTCICIF